MDLTLLVSVLSYAGMGVGGWLLKTLWSMVQELKNDVGRIEKAVSDTEKSIAKEYVSKLEFQQLADRILDEIRDFRKEVRDDMKNKADK